MGLFGKSDEEKKLEEAKKLEKRKEEIREALTALGLDFENSTDDELRNSNNEWVAIVRANMPKNIVSEAIVNASLQPFERLSLIRLDDIVAQNWIQIRQNELITRYLKKICDLQK